ncbi:MAG: NYN domain-containing protein [Alphaproteobacteria bacterium]
MIRVAPSDSLEMLDMATHADNPSVDRIALITNDTDCVPAVKPARKAGLQVILVSMAGQPQCARDLLWHTAFRRTIP